MSTMKSFGVIFVYTDGEKLTVEIPEPEIENFMDSVGKSVVYWQEEKKMGIWIPIEKVRYFQVIKKGEEDDNQVSELQSDEQRNATGDGGSEL